MNNIYKDLRVAAIIVLAICLVTIAIEYLVSGRLTWSLIKDQIYYNAYYGFPLSFTLSWFFDFINRKISWFDYPRKRAVVGILGTIIIAMVLLILLNFFLWVVIEGKPINSLYLKSNRLFYVIGLIITIVVTSIMHAIGFFVEVMRERAISLKLRQQKLSSELNALRAHVDPHFLFNSFNVLSGLIDEDSEKAQTFLSGLSGIYRYILEQRNEATSTLKDELIFADKYLALQRMRFENAIELDTQIGLEFMDRKLPSLSLQLLLENAIKHNGFDANNPLKLSLNIQEDKLIVSNNINPRKDHVAKNGVGLKNIDDRYELLSKNKIEIINGDKHFIVKLPLL